MCKYTKFHWCVVIHERVISYINFLIEQILLLKWFLNVKYVLLHNVLYMSTFYG